MKIGSIEIQGHVVLGPMAGVSTLAYREFMKPFGVGLSYSEMISDCGIDYKNEKTYQYLATSELDSPVGLQLFGFSAEKSVQAIQILEKVAKYDILDINLGCPVPKVTRTGAGSAWLKNPEALEEYMKAICQASSKPVTAKIRLGWDSENVNVFEVSKRLERAGVQAITVHCRTKAQGYAGEADYRAVAGLKETLSIPLIISGDIFTAEKAKEALDITHADAVMVARGGMGNPFLVTQINHYLDTGELLPNPTVLQQVEYAESYAWKLIELKGEEVAVKELRGILPHFFTGFPGHKKIRLALAVNASTKKDLEAIFNGIRQQNS